MEQQSQRGRRNYTGGRFNHHHHHHYPHSHHHSHSRGTSHGRDGRSSEYYSTPSTSQQRNANGGTGTGGGTASISSSDINNNYLNQGGRATLSTWRNLMRRQTELFNEKSRNLREVDAKEFELKKAELLHLQKGSNNNKGAKEQPHQNKNKKDKLEMENSENHSRGDAKNKPDKGETENGKSSNGPSGSSSSETVLKENESASTPQDDTVPKPVKPHGVTYDDIKFYDAEAERFDVNRICQQRERKLDMDMQRFFQDVERQLTPPERRMDPRMMEELLVRDQQIAMFHQRVLNLEEKNRNCAEELEFFRQLVQQLTQSSAQQQQEFAAEKEILVAKAKAETMAQLIRLSGNSDMWNDPFLSTDPKLNLDASDYANHHPLLSSPSFHAWVSESDSPCLQPMPTFCGTGIMTDLRDRYEDVKCAGYLERHARTEWVLKMIRKVVMFYEDNNMRVYEEALTNQCVSTLIWCPNDSLCPQKSQSSFSFGYGATPLAATEIALQHAYHRITEMEEKNLENSENTESKDIYQSLLSPKLEKSNTIKVNEHEPPEEESDELHQNNCENTPFATDSTQT